MTTKIIGSEKVKRGMAQMQKGGVIMDVVNAEQARIAEAAGAVADEVDDGGKFGRHVLEIPCNAVSIAVRRL